MSYQDKVFKELLDPPLEFLECTKPACTIHTGLLNDYANHIVSTLLDSACCCFPSSVSSLRKLAGWNDGAAKLKKQSVFWHNVWTEAGCPSAGVLSSIKKQAKKRFKYEVRRLKRRQQYFYRSRIAHSFAQKRKNTFWSDIKRLNSSGASPSAPVVDGVCGDTNIANLFAAKFSDTLNKHSSGSRSTLLSSVQSSLSATDLSSVCVSEELVAEAIFQLKPHKSDGYNVTSEHLKYASTVIAKPLSSLFTAILRHGYMPECFRDSIIVPIPKGSKDASKSSNYRPIALSSNFSKILERVILSLYQPFFSTSVLQFGFKPGHSTTLCSAMVKNVVSRYIHNGSPVLGCFLDASKAFDLIDHGILFDTLMKRGLPFPIVRFLASWYSMQKMQVRWDKSLSEPFSVSNGVRQGSVLSPHLFAVYIDSLLLDLCDSGVGCYWGCSFVGAFSYADDVVLLAPCASALRLMLQICCSFSVSHKLTFNATKTQLICFYAPSVCPITPAIYFNGIKLSFMDQVIHLGHILTDDLDDTADILRAVKDLNRKANSLLCTFKFLDPLIMTFLLKFYCLSLYGCCLWSLNTPAIRIIEIALNKVLRKIWHLPSRAHTGIVHCVAQVHTISNMLYDRFQLFLSKASSSSSSLIRSIITESGYHVNCFTGYNLHYGHSHVRHFYNSDINRAIIIRSIRITFGFCSDFESLLCNIACE